MTQPRPSPSSDASADGVALRLLWPRWQGAGTASVQALAPEFPFELARRGYAVGSTVLAAVLPANQGPTVAALTGHRDPQVQELLAATGCSRSRSISISAPSTATSSGSGSAPSRAG